MPALTLWEAPAGATTRAADVFTIAKYDDRSATVDGAANDVIDIAVTVDRIALNQALGLGPHSYRVRAVYTAVEAANTPANNAISFGGNPGGIDRGVITLIFNDTPYVVSSADSDTQMVTVASAGGFTQTWTSTRPDSAVGRFWTALAAAISA